MRLLEGTLATALLAVLFVVAAPVPAHVPLFVVPVAGFARTVSLLPGGVGGVGPPKTTLPVAQGDRPGRRRRPAVPGGDRPGSQD